MSPPQSRKSHRKSSKSAVSLNHLINFTLPPRERPSPAPRKPQKTSSSTFKKDQYVHANFRFLVRPGGDYSVQSWDPDIPVNWDDVIQVLVLNKQSPHCPICLSSPLVAPRITKCGHSFCFHCILQYLAQKDDAGKRENRRCPLCFVWINAADLKSVHFIPQTLQTDEKTWITFTLMKRERTSTIALPRISTLPEANSTLMSSVKHTFGELPWQNAHGATLFSKLTLVSTEYEKKEILEKDLRQLQDSLTESVLWEEQGYSSTDKIHIENAIRIISERLEAIEPSYVETALAEEENITCESESEKTLENLSQVLESTSLSLDEQSSYSQQRGSSLEPAFTDDEDIQDSSLNAPTAVSDIFPVEGNENLNKEMEKNDDTGCFYFYQASDGQHIYLHPLENRILKEEYGSYEKFPNTISAKCEYYQESQVNEDIRKRCRHLAHLPLMCEIAFCEIEIKPLVSNTVFKEFYDQLQERRKGHKRKEKKEEKALKREEERRKRSQQEDQVPSGFFTFGSHYPPNPQEPSYQFGTQINPVASSVSRGSSFNEADWPSMDGTKSQSAKQGNSPGNVSFTSFADVLGGKSSTSFIPNSPISDHEPMRIVKGKKKQLVWMMGGGGRGGRQAS